MQSYNQCNSGVKNNYIKNNDYQIKYEITGVQKNHICKRIIKINGEKLKQVILLILKSKKMLQNLFL